MVIAATEVRDMQASNTQASNTQTAGAGAAAGTDAGVGAGAPTPDVGAPYLDEERFTALVERTPGLALIDFTADWCPPCRRLAPAIDALARELAGSLAVAKVDADEQPALAARFHVRSLPTLLFFHNGHLVDTIVGAVPLAQLRARATELGALPV